MVDNFSHRKFLFCSFAIAFSTAILSVGCMPQRSNARLSEVEITINYLESAPYIYYFPGSSLLHTIDIEMDYESDSGHLDSITKKEDRGWGKETQEISFSYTDDMITEIEYENKEITADESDEPLEEILIDNNRGNLSEIELDYNSQGLLSDYDLDDSHSSVDYDSEDRVSDIERTSNYGTTELELSYDSDTGLLDEGQYEFNSDYGNYKIEYEFLYDGENRIVKRKSDWVIDGEPYFFDTKFEYNDEGLIEEINGDHSWANIEINFTYEEGNFTGGTFSPFGLWPFNMFFDLEGKNHSDIDIFTSGFVFQFSYFDRFFFVYW